MYLLNEATLGRWIAAAGIRFDDFKDTSTRQSFADDKVSLCFGLVHRVRDDISLFAQWSESYEPQTINTAFALGGDYVDERLSLSGQRVKSYTVYDASVIWEHGRFMTLLCIENLFDDIYAESGFLSRTGHFPGDPRTYFFEIYAEW